MLKTKYFVLCGFMLFAMALLAQQTALPTAPTRLYADGLELFNHKNFGAAQRSFRQYTNHPHSTELLKADARYYEAICALELQNKNGEYLLMSFVNDYPNSNRAASAYYELGKYYFGQKKNKKVIEYFKKTDITKLTAKQKEEYNFKYGYALFAENDYSNAFDYLQKAANVKNNYTSAATYYLAHIYYSKKDYNAALQKFETLQTDAAFGPVVGYYMVQIYYLQKKYDQAASLGKALVDTTKNQKRLPEMAHIVGDSYYRKGEFTMAIPYLEKYVDKGLNISPQDHYQLGYSYYKAADYTKAIDQFKEAALADDSLGQNAHYHLGASYLKLNNKPSARDEFAAAARTSFDKDIEENALFNFAKLAYELDYSPYNEAVRAFETYLNRYPKSDKKDEAYTYLVNVYLTTKNYKAALESLDKIKVKDSKLKEAYQKVAFYRGIELFNDQKFADAMTYFDKSMANNINPTTYALTYYWKAETYYRQNKFDKAADAFDQFQGLPAANTLPEFARAYYNAGYSFFKLEKYAKAAPSFRLYVKNADTKESKKIADALLRLGDCYFMDGQYPLAADFYGQAAEKLPNGSDYALFQKSIVSGLANDYKSKVDALKQLITKYPKSPYQDDARYQMGLAYEFLNDNTQALASYEDMLAKYPSSSLAKNTKVRIALIHYGNNDDAKALAMFEDIITKYPDSEEARTSLDAIEDIAVKSGDMAIYNNLVKTLPFANKSEAKLDSVNYDAAYYAYSRSDCEKSIVNFNNYLKTYPKGIFTLQANYYLAECEYSKNNEVEALPHYTYVALKPKNKFSEKATRTVAVILYNKNNFADALGYFEKLEEIAEKPENTIDALAGQMRCNYKLKKYAKAIESANKLTATDKTDPQLVTEAQVTVGRSAIALNDYTTAKAEFSRIVKIKSELGAEAKYYLAYIAYNEKEYKKVGTLVEELANEFSGYDYWIAKGYVLWADAYYAQGDLYNAKLYLQVILDNYEGKDEVRDDAQTKMNKILDEEAKQNAPQDAPAIEITLPEEDATQPQQNNE